MKVEIAKIRLLQSYYPRDGLDNEIVNSYRLNVSALPPITITKDFILVDGYHRLVAHRVEGLGEIQVEEPLLDIEGSEIFIEGLKRNAYHGKALTMKEKRSAARKIFEDGYGNESKIAKLLAVSEGSISKWVQDIRQEKMRERNEQILELYLACYTEEEIADRFEIARTTVNTIVNKFKNEFSDSPPDSYQLYNVWNFPKADRQYGLDYPGRIPGQIIENLLYYYTNPFDTVVDPMAGGGTTIDVCKVLYRRYQAYDINPVRDDINKHDIKQGFPPKAKNCDLIFLDPPYWRLQKDQYTEESTSFASLEEWISFMDKLADDCYKTLRQGGYAALLIEAFLDEKVTGKFLDLPFECLKLFTKAGFSEVQRITTPMPSQIKDVHDVEYSKSKKIMLDLNRDLIVLKREK